MTATPHNNKTALWAFLLIFGLIELPFTRDWLWQQGGLAGLHFDFMEQLRFSPIYQVTFIDFAATALLVFIWMIGDSKRREDRKKAWFWLPAFLFSPTLGLIGYLLTRKDYNISFSSMINRHPSVNTQLDSASESV